MLAKLTEFNAKVREPDFEPLAIGLGLHTGPAIVGNIGSPKRKTFTAIGSTVNIAARVEGVTKIVGHPLVLTHATRDALADPPPLIALADQQLKGVELPLKLFAPANGR